MASSIVIDNAEGTELQIPAVGLDRGGEINISANHGFFKVERTDSVTHSMVKTHTLNRAGAIITGFQRATINNVFLWFPYTERADKPFKVWGAILNGERNWNYYTYAEGNIYTANGFTNNDSALGNLTNVYGDTYNGARILGATNHSKLYYTYHIKDFLGGKNTDNFKLLTNIYIEEDTFSADGYLITPFWNIKLFRDGYQLWNGSDFDAKIAYKNNYTIPAQEWVSIEMDFVNPNIELSGGVVKLVLNGVDQEITPNPHCGGKAIYLVGHTGGDTAHDYVRYSPIYMVNYDLVERKLGTSAKDEVITTIRNLITPV